MTCRTLAASILALLGALACPSASAQQTPFTGWEVALSGSPTVLSGHTARFRGTTYHVRGVQTLVAEPAPLRARYAFHTPEHAGRDWVSVQPDAEGRFELALPVPSGVAEGEPRLEVEVGPERRRVTIPLEVESGVQLLLRADRQLYEAGEPVHLWALVRDSQSLAPIAGAVVEFDLRGESMPGTHHELTTGAAGMAHVELSVPPGAAHGQMAAHVSVNGESPAVARFAVGTRTYERLLAEVAITPEPVAPGERAEVRVAVTTPSGSPVYGASVRASIEAGSTSSATTGTDGVARITLRSPSYATHDTGSVPVHVHVEHPGHGALDTVAPMRLAIPLSLHVEVIPAHGGLLPEVDDTLFVRLRDGLGEPPAEGTEITLEGPMFPGGQARAVTDRDGLAEVTARAMVGSASGGDGEVPTAFIHVTVAGPLERVVRAELPILRESDVAPVLERVILAPGETVRVRLLRRPSARGDVVVDLLADGVPLATRWVQEGVREARFDAPMRLGVLQVRARLVREDRTVEGTGAMAAMIVRPALASPPRVEPERVRWAVGETARLNLRTPAGAPASYAAVLVRDLAAHGGEVPFDVRFLRGRFDEDIVTSQSDSRLVRAALASHAALDPWHDPPPPRLDALGLPSRSRGGTAAGGRHTLRDPYRLASGLEAHSGEAMRYAERTLSRALTDGRVQEITEGAGAGRRFIERLFATRTDRTLGGGPLTPALLEAYDPAFTFHHVARRVARARLVELMVALAAYLDPGEGASPAAQMAAREPSSRWLPRLVETGALGPHALDDPWGNRFVLRTSRSPVVVLGVEATELELVSAGPDGRFGSADDVRDPFARAVPPGTPYAVAAGEDRLMRQVAVLRFAEATLEAIREAYRRTLAEMTEERIGDAVSAETSEGTISLSGLGTIGHGAGGGSGSGYGRGAGGLRGRRSAVPRVGLATSAANLGALVRERFPPTLLFRPALVLDADGETSFEVPLADAVTTYLVEAVVWRADGWISSASARIEVERGVVVEAPVPAAAHRGDRLLLPLRVSNRSDVARRLTVQLRGDSALGIPNSAPTTVDVAPGGAAVIPVELEAPSLGAGTLTVVATDPEGAVVDAVRRPLVVRAPTRLTRRVAEALADGEARLLLEVPNGADARAGTVRVSAGPAIFEAASSGDPWAAWADGGVPDNEPSTSEELAAALGAGWSVAAVESETLQDRAHRLTQSMMRDRVRAERQDEARADQVRRAAWTLLGLAPAVQAPSARHDVPEVLDLVSRLRHRVAAEAVALEADPESWVTAAAALGATGADPARVRELLRRLERHVVAIDEDRWLPTADAPARSTLLAALAELGVGERSRAFAYVATIGRWVAAGHTLRPRELALGRAVVRRLMAGTPTDDVVVWIDGERSSLPLPLGSAELPADQLAQPGAHRVRVVANGAPVWVRAVARFGVPFVSRPSPPGPFAVELEGALGGRDETADLHLTIQNRMPRTLSRPRVVVQLPTGAELPALAQRRIEATGAEVSRGEGVLTLRLPPMLPGATRDVPLPLRWSVAGRLLGLGVAAMAEDRPDDATVLPSRWLQIDAPGDEQ